MAKKEEHVVKTITTKTVTHKKAPAKKRKIVKNKPFKKVSKPNRKAARSPPASRGFSNAELEKMLINNFTHLQKIQTNLTIKLEELTEKIARLLNLFEISAKSFIEKQGIGTGLTKEDKAFLQKLDKVAEQNQTIAKALTIMEQMVREKVGYRPEQKTKIATEPLNPNTLQRF